MIVKGKCQFHSSPLSLPLFSLLSQGMGGQLNYFGLWISAEYGTGHSKAAPKCSTYGSPVLSHKDEFHIDVLELWGIGEPVIPDKEVGV